jgi:hypothetical protein
MKERDPFIDRAEIARRIALVRRLKRRACGVSLTPERLDRVLGREVPRRAPRRLPVLRVIDDLFSRSPGSRPLAP